MEVWVLLSPGEIHSKELEPVSLALGEIRSVPEKDPIPLQVSYRKCSRFPEDPDFPGAAGEAQDCSRISANLFGMFFHQNSHKIVILSGAPHRFIA